MDIQYRSGDAIAYGSFPGVLLGAHREIAIGARSLTLRLKNRLTLSIGGRMSDPKEVELSGRSLCPHPAEGCELVPVDLVLPGLNVKDQELAPVPGMQQRADVPLEERLTSLRYLVAGEAGVGHGGRMLAGAVAGPESTALRDQFRILRPQERRRDHPDAVRAAIGGRACSDN